MGIAAAGTIELHDSADGEYFANAVEHVGHLLAERHAGLRRRRLLQQLVGRGHTGGGQNFCQVVGKLLGFGTSRHRSAFAFELDHRPFARGQIGKHGDAASLGIAAEPGLFDLLALLTQKLDGRFHIALRLAQGLLAVHHREAGLLA